MSKEYFGTEKKRRKGISDNLITGLISEIIPVSTV